METLPKGRNIHGKWGIANEENSFLRGRIALCSFHTSKKHVVLVHKREFIVVPVLYYVGYFMHRFDETSAAAVVQGDDDGSDSDASYLS